MAEEWASPLSCKRRKLKTVLKEMEPFSLLPEEVPLIIRIIENPKYDIGLFGGATTLGAHDCIHILLGRGLLVKDEAFVIGYTMGSAKTLSRWRKRPDGSGVVEIWDGNRFITSDGSITLKDFFPPDF